MSAPILRTLHRDLGWLMMGLTLVYALSGLAVNHIGSWDPNFVRTERVVQLGTLTGPASQVAEAAFRGLDIHPTQFSVTDLLPTRVDVTFPEGVISVNMSTGAAALRADRPRFALRSMNWLHLNRGKGAWTWVADAYAASLLILAVTGLFILPIRRQMLGRGGVLLLIGALTPMLWVWAYGPK